MEKQINQSLVNDITQLIQFAFQDTVTKETNVTWEQLQEQAKNFLQGYQALEKQGDMLFDELKKTILSTDPTIMGYINLLFKNKNLFLIRSKYLLAFHFDDYLKRFRDLLPSEAAFVHSDKEQNLTTYILPMKSLAMSVNKEGRINVNNTRLKNENISILEENQEGIYSEQHIQEALQAYKGTVNRLDRYYNKVGLKGGKRQGGLLMWKVNHEWQTGTVSNYGDVKEAYLAFLTSEHSNQLCKKAGGNAPYYNHDLIGGFFNSYINQVTNLSAIVEEDVLQYAVKSKGARMPSLSQYVKTAQYILNHQYALSKEDIEYWIREVEFTQNEKRNVNISLNQIMEKYGQDIYNAVQDITSS